MNKIYPILSISLLLASMAEAQQMRGESGYPKVGPRHELQSPRSAPQYLQDGYSQQQRYVPQRFDQRYSSQQQMTEGSITLPSGRTIRAEFMNGNLFLSNEDKRVFSREMAQAKRGGTIQIQGVNGYIILPVNPPSWVEKQLPGLVRSLPLRYYPERLEGEMVQIVLPSQQSLQGYIQNGKVVLNPQDQARLEEASSFETGPVRVFLPGNVTVGANEPAMIVPLILLGIRAVGRLVSSLG